MHTHRHTAHLLIFFPLEGTHTHCHSLMLACTYSHTQPENILLFRKGSLDIKIADFGLSVQVKEGQEMKNLVGTAEYVCKYTINTNMILWSIYFREGSCKRSLSKTAKSTIYIRTRERPFHNGAQLIRHPNFAILHTSVSDFKNS